MVADSVDGLAGELVILLEWLNCWKNFCKVDSDQIWLEAKTFELARVNALQNSFKKNFELNKESFNKETSWHNGSQRPMAIGL